MSDEQLSYQDVKKQNRLYLIEYLLASPCYECGEVDPMCLDFHHTGQKSFNISSGVCRKSLLEIKQELSKCAVLCANCHSILHWKSDFERTSQLVSTGTAARRRRNRARTRQKLWNHKQEHPCSICGFVNAKALCFRSRNGSGNNEVKQFITQTWTKVQQEMANCDVVCHNCRRKLAATIFDTDDTTT